MLFSKISKAVLSASLLLSLTVVSGNPATGGSGGTGSSGGDNDNTVAIVAGMAVLGGAGWYWAKQRAGGNQVALPVKRKRVAMKKRPSAATRHRHPQNKCSKTMTHSHKNGNVRHSHKYSCGRK